MKRLFALLLAIILCFCLEACSRKTETVPDTQEVPTRETSQRETEAAETTAATEEPIQLNYDLIGPDALCP